MKSLALTLASIAAALFISGVSSQAQSIDPGARERNAPPPAAPRATTDPLRAIYLVPGVTDDGSADNTGVATSFHCFNQSTVTENLQFTIRNSAGTNVRTTAAIAVATRATFTASTHQTVIFIDAGANQDLNTGFVLQGTAIIRATSDNVFCTAMIVDAAATAPQGIALHMIRSNPADGFVE